MDHETREMFQTIINGMESMEQRLKDYVKGEIKSSEERMREEIKSSEQRTMVYIENNVTKRIDALFDGYKLTHEKQWELERRTDQLQNQIEELRERLAALEHQSA